jgi:hypothetical protein
MPDWIFWALFGWLVFVVVGGRRRAGCGRRYRRESLERARRPEALSRGVPAELPPQRPTREEREERLRARYVSGEISVEEYERGLDRLYRQR